MMLIDKSKKTKISSNHWQETCKNVLLYLSGMNYSKTSLYRYSAIYGRLIKYLYAGQKLHVSISQKSIDTFLQFCGLLDFNIPPNLHETQVRYKRAMKILLEYHQKGSVESHCETQSCQISLSYENLLEQYRQFFLTVKETIPEASLREDIRNIREFLSLLCSYKICTISKIQFKHVQAYFQKFSCRKPDTVARRARKLKFFFSYLISKNLVTSRILGFIPHVSRIKSFRLSVIWSQKSVKKLLSVVNRKTSIGKRDYAICILISQLGLRVGDVRLLKLENINWRKGTISIIQEKTKKLLELPFSEEVGLALIDYLKNGRPISSLRNIFIRNRAPFTVFKTSSAFTVIIEKYRNKANISFPEGSLHGFHSLRHSLATRLHEENVPFPVIASILGHSSLDSTRLYARSNIEMLRTAALEWEDV